MLAAGAHTGGFGCAAAFVDVADEREDVPQPTRARPVSSPAITRTAWHEVVGLLRDSRAVSGAQCPLIKVSPDMKVVITLDPEAALQPADRLTGSATKTLDRAPVHVPGPRRRSRYARTLAREPHTDIAHQLLAWLRLWS